MPVLIEKPFSFDVEEMLLKADIIPDKKLSLLDPETGQEINDVLANLPAIGLTFAPTPDHRQPMGFLPGTLLPKDESLDDPLKPSFDPEAILIFDSGDIPVPKEFKDSEIWVIQVKYQENEETYIKVAKQLCEMYPKLSVMVTSAYKRLNSGNISDAAALKHESTRKIGISRVEPTALQPSS